MLKFVDDVLPVPLPREADFDPFGSDLDAQSAWRNFGGLSLQDAYTKFCENPEVYQEDFMFMGSRAFHYYFPVVDEYLRSARASEAYNDCQAVLGSCIAAQFDWKGAQVTATLRGRISDLCDFILGNQDRFAL